MKRVCLLAATALAVLAAAALGGRATAHAAGICAFPTSSTTGGSPITVSGTTATATFDVVSVPCTVNLISYQSQITGPIPVGSTTQTFTTPGHYTLQVNLQCGTDNQIELFLGSPPPTSSTDIGAFSATPSCGSGGAFTQGYWKNHASAWPGPVLVGSTTVSVSQGVDILKTPPKGGDATLILAHQLIAAELNVAGGADSSCIASTIAAANALLAAHPVGSGLKSSSADGATATQLASTLDAYNSGKLCAASGE